MSFRINFAYRRFSPVKLLELAYIIHQSISTRTSVFATPSPTMPVFKDACDELQSAITNAGDGSKLSKEQVKVTKAALVAKMDSLANYVAFIANGDRAIALQSGFPLQKAREQQVLGNPGTPVVTLTSQPGEVELSLATVSGAASYLHQFTDDPELKPESWKSMNCTPANCLLTGLTPGKVYYFRVGAIGTRDQMLYSPVVSRMVA